MSLSGVARQSPGDSDLPSTLKPVLSGLSVLDPTPVPGCLGRLTPSLHFLGKTAVELKALWKAPARRCSFPRPAPSCEQPL